MLGIKLIEVNLDIESPLMHKSLRHSELSKPKLKEKQVARRTGSSHHTTAFHGHVATDLISVKDRFKFSPKPASISTASEVHSKSEAFMEIGSLPMICRAITNNHESPFNKMPVPPLHCLGSGLDPFSTMFQSKKTRVSIEQLKHSCMYYPDERQYLSDTV